MTLFPYTTLFLICLRSIARTVPSEIGSSYLSPVRLSVTVSVSAVACDGPPTAASVRAVLAIQC